MNVRQGSCPLTKRQIADEFFIENRTRILDIAAFLDRLDRSRDQAEESDFRLEAFRHALLALCRDAPHRVTEIQMIFSDPTTEPRSQLDQKSAHGAFKEETQR